MKSPFLLSCLLLALVFAAGCTKKPAAYAPKTPAETAIVTFYQQKAPTLVVVSITQALKPPTPINSADRAQGGMPTQYRVEAADAKDASMKSTGMVFVNEKTNTVDEQMTPTISPAVKVN